ncbi:hypothetical protein O6H91_21G015900 [Diphasiastrum complanatum]|uniref:Uncharacterized protein n=1 Tax=Diphasiastrum complanatum TaxID=34168 RepID=A0ACC2AK06_DIPCM|nr:hypothetical protein O6H91_21G015900 [Diphasiastrum complanatum]
MAQTQCTLLRRPSFHTSAPYLPCRISTIAMPVGTPRVVRLCLGVRATATGLLPPEFGYVALTAASSVVLTQWQSIQVFLQRRKSGVKYPKMYEDVEGSIFNCYQRAHQNTLENYPAFLVLLLVSGLAYPITASIFGLVWVIGRVFYSFGYYTGDPQNRLKGAWNTFGLLGLLVTSLVFTYRQLVSLWLLPS